MSVISIDPPIEGDRAVLWTEDLVAIQTCSDPERVDREDRRVERQGELDLENQSGEPAPARKRSTLSSRPIPASKPEDAWVLDYRGANPSFGIVEELDAE